MIMPVLGEVAKQAPTEPERKKSALGLCEKPSVSKVLNSFLFDYLLLPYGSHPSLKPADPKETIKIPAGMSDYGWKRVSGEKLETGVVGFLVSFLNFALE